MAVAQLLFSTIRSRSMVTADRKPAAFALAAHADAVRHLSRGVSVWRCRVCVAVLSGQGKI